MSVTRRMTKIKVTLTTMTIFSLILLALPNTTAVSSEDNNYKILCTPDTATIQSNGYTQDCYYTNKQNNPVNITVLYCLNTRLLDGKITYKDNIVNETTSFFGLFHHRDIVGYTNENIDLNITQTENYVELNEPELKPYCYTTDETTIESGETRKVTYNYLPVDDNYKKWDTYIYREGNIVFALDPQFSPTIYEIGTNRSTYYYWINGTTLNVDILNYTNGMSVKSFNISNFENRTNTTVLESKFITLTNFISVVRINMSFFGNVSLNYTVDNGTTWSYLTNTNLSNKTIIYNWSTTEDNNLLQYYITLGRYLDSNLAVNGTNIIYTNQYNVTNTPTAVDWRENNVSKAMINLGMDKNDTSILTDYSTNNHYVKIGS